MTCTAQMVTKLSGSLLFHCSLPALVPRKRDPVQVLRDLEVAHVSVLLLTRPTCSVASSSRRFSASAACSLAWRSAIFIQDDGASLRTGLTRPRHIVQHRSQRIQEVPRPGRGSKCSLHLLYCFRAKSEGAMATKYMPCVHRDAEEGTCTSWENLVQSKHTKDVLFPCNERFLAHKKKTNGDHLLCRLICFLLCMSSSFPGCRFLLNQVLQLRFLYP